MRYPGQPHRHTSPRFVVEITFHSGKTMWYSLKRDFHVDGLSPNREDAAEWNQQNAANAAMFYAESPDVRSANVVPARVKAGVR